MQRRESEERGRLKRLGWRTTAAAQRFPLHPIPPTRRRRLNSHPSSLSSLTSRRPHGRRQPAGGHGHRRAGLHEGGLGRRGRKAGARGGRDGAGRSDRAGRRADGPGGAESGGGGRAQGGRHLGDGRRGEGSGWRRGEGRRAEGCRVALGVGWDECCCAHSTVFLCAQAPERSLARARSRCRPAPSPHARCVSSPHSLSAKQGGPKHACMRRASSSVLNLMPPFLSLHRPLSLPTRPARTAPTTASA